MDPNPLSDGTQTHALGAIISLWLDRARDMQGRFRTALCMTALGRLLETAHPRLSEIQVVDRCDRMCVWGGPEDC